MKYCAMTTIMRFLTILLLSISLAGGMSGTASAADAALSPQEGTLLELINQARQNPLGVAASMGMDPEKILAGPSRAGEDPEGGPPAPDVQQHPVRCRPRPHGGHVRQ